MTLSNNGLSCGWSAAIHGIALSPVAEQESKVKQTRHASRPSASPVDTMLMLML